MEHLPHHDSWCAGAGREKMPLTAGANHGGFQRLGPSPKQGSRIRQEVVRASHLHTIKQREDANGLE